MPKGMLGMLPLSAVRGPVDALYDNLAGDDGERWLAALKRFNRGENPFWSKSLDLFNPTTFIGKGWEVVGERKPLHEGFDPSKLKVVATPLKEGESSITGDEAKKRLTDHPLAGVEVFWQCWNNRDLLPKELRDKIIFFDGDELRNPDDNRCSLCLHWSIHRWRWFHRWQGFNRCADYVSALAS